MSGGAAKPDTWMPWYIGDYLADTMHLTRDQHGGYMLLIMAYWRNGGPLPDDDDKLAAIVKASPAEWRKLRPALAGFFHIGDGEWMQGRAQQELDDATKITNERSKAGSNGAAKRWQTHGVANGKEDGKPHGKRKAKRWQTDAPLPSPSQPHSPSSEGEKTRARDFLKVEDWEPNEETSAFAAEQGLEGDALSAELSRFRDYHVARGHERADWNADFRSWLRRKPDFENGADQPSDAKPLTAAEKAERQRRESCSLCAGKGWVRGKQGMVRCDHGANAVA